MAGRKGTTGGRRKGAGRKTKAEELGLPRLLAACITDAERKALFRVLKKKALAGEDRALELVLAYLYGKPIQPVQQSGELQLLVMGKSNWKP